MEMKIKDDLDRVISSLEEGLVCDEIQAEVQFQNFVEEEKNNILSKINKKQKRLNSNNEKENKNEVEKEALGNEIAALLDKNTLLEDQLSSKERLIWGLEINNEKMREDFETQKVRYQHLLEDIERLHRDSETLEKSKREIENEKNMSAREIKSLVDEKNILTNEYIQSFKKYDSDTNTVETLACEIKELAKKVSTKNKEIQSLEEEKDVLIDSHQDLSYEKNKYTEQLSEIERHIAKLNKQRSVLENDLREREELNRSLGRTKYEKIKELNREKERFTNLQITYLSVEENLKECQSNLTIKDQEERRLRSKISLWESEIKAMEIELNSIATEISLQDERVELLQERKESLSVVVKKNKNETFNLNEQLQEILSKGDVIKEEILFLHDKIEVDQIERELISEQMKIKNHELQERESQLEMMRSDYQTRVEEKAILSSELSSLKKTLYRICSERKRIEDELIAIKEKKENIQHEVIFHESEKIKNEQNLEKLNKDYEVLNREVTFLEQQRQEATQFICQIEIDISDEKEILAALGEKKREVLNQIWGVQKEYEDSQQHLEKLRSVVNILQDAINKKQETKLESQKKFMETENKVKELELKEKEMQETYQWTVREMERQRSEEKTVDIQMSCLEQKREFIESELTMMGPLAAAISTRTAIIMKNCQRHKEKLIELEELKENEQKTIDQLNEENKTSAELLVKLELAVSNAQKSLHTSSARVAEYKQNIFEKKKAIECFEQELAEKVAKISDLEKIIKRKKDEDLSLEMVFAALAQERQALDQGLKLMLNSSSEIPQIPTHGSLAGLSVTESEPEDPYRDELQFELLEAERELSVKVDSRVDWKSYFLTHDFQKMTKALKRELKKYQGQNSEATVTIEEGKLIFKIRKMRKNINLFAL